MLFSFMSYLYVLAWWWPKGSKHVALLNTKELSLLTTSYVTISLTQRNVDIQPKI
jgi:hypothetical protein